MDNREIRLANLRYAICLFGGTAALAEAAECNKKYLDQIVQGFQSGKDKNPRKLGDKVSAKIARAMGHEPYWMDQPHPELWEQDTAIHQGRHGLSPLDKNTGIVTILRYDTGGSMGGGIVLHDQPGIIESWRVSKGWLSENVRGYTSTDNLAIVTGFGDSMRPTYNPGDPLIVDKGVTTVEFDSVYFFRIDDVGYVKRLQRIPTPNGLIIKALSDNRALYEPFEIREGMNFEVLARVVQIWRREDY